MADTKISALPASTTPLAGTEVLPIVQSGSTVKVSVANLTVGRDVTMDNATVNGHVTVLAGDVRFDEERFVYSYAGGTVGQYMSGTYYDGSGGTQRVFLNNAEVGRWTGTDLQVKSGNFVVSTSGSPAAISASRHAVRAAAAAGSAGLGSAGLGSAGGAGDAVGASAGRGVSRRQRPSGVWRQVTAPS